MSADTPGSKKILAVRTYASDLAVTRAQRDHTDVAASDGTQVQTTTAVTTLANEKVTSSTSTTKAKLVFTEPKTKPQAKTAEPIALPQTVVKKNTLETKTAIPPFHTFQKPAVTIAVPIPAKPVVTKISAPTGAVPTTVKPSILTGQSHGIAVGDEADAATAATVITDTKRKKFSLSAAISESMSGWFQSKKDTLTGKNKPKYTVPQADRRKGVIQKATSMTGRTSTADHAEVLKRLRANKQNAGIVPVTPAKTNVTPTEPTWGSAEPAAEKRTPTSVPVQTIAPEPVNVVPAPLVRIPPVKKVITPAAPTPVIQPKIIPEKPLPVISPRIPTPEPVVITPTIPLPVQPKPIEPSLPLTPTNPSLPVIKTEPTPVITPVVKAPIAPTPAPVIAAVRPPITPIIPATLAETDIITPSPETYSSPTPTVVLTPSTPVDTVPTNPLPVLKNLRTQLESIFSHTDRIVISGGIVACVIVVIGFGIRVYMHSAGETSKPDQSEVTPFSQMTLRPEPVLANSKEAVITVLHEVAEAPDSLTEIRVIDPVSSSTITAQSLFALFGIHVLARFESSITHISLGAYRGEPWLLLHVTDTPTAQGGMLDWENTMRDDLQLWYGEISLATKKSTAITPFTDSTINGIDIRTLKDQQKTERITYGFVAPNYILITTNSTAWLNLHDHWQTE